MQKIRKQINKIKDDELFSPEDVIKMGVVVNTKLVPSVFTLYRLVKRGQLKVINLGSGGSPRYFVKGADLKEFLRERYQIGIIK